MTHSAFQNEKGDSVFIRAEGLHGSDIVTVFMQLGWRSSGGVRLELTRREALELQLVLRRHLESQGIAEVAAILKQDDAGHKANGVHTNDG